MNTMYYVFFGQNFDLSKILFLVLGITVLLLWNFDIWPFWSKEKREVKRQQRETKKEEEWKKLVFNSSFEALFSSFKHPTFDWTLKQTKTVLVYQDLSVSQLVTFSTTVMRLIQYPKSFIDIDPEIQKIVDNELLLKIDKLIKQLKIKGGELKIFDRENIEILKSLYSDLGIYYTDTSNTETRSIIQKRIEAKWLQSVMQVFEYLKNNKDSSEKELRESYQELLILCKNDWPISLEIAQAINDC